MLTKPTVLVFAGLDPSGGAGLAADICAINAMGAHALPVLTVMTAQDNNRVHRVQAVAPEWLRLQAQIVIETIPVAAVKIGIIGSLANALVLADVIAALRTRQPDLPVVLDPVLGSGRGDALAQDDPVQIIQALLRWASVILPNRPEAARLAAGIQGIESQARFLLQAGCGAVLLKGGHADEQTDEQTDAQSKPQANTAQVVNHWFAPNEHQSWQWPRLPGEFHGSGCTLASALAAALALQLPQPVLCAQHFTQAALAGAYAVADGQLMPARVASWQQEDV
jgi:hydroxymethylpyrimidine/phosphomethylpyrimidine kinase